MLVEHLIHSPKDVAERKAMDEYEMDILAMQDGCHSRIETRNSQVQFSDEAKSKKFVDSAFLPG